MGSCLCGRKNAYLNTYVLQMLFSNKETAHLYESSNANVLLFSIARSRHLNLMTLGGNPDFVYSLRAAVRQLFFHEIF